MSVNKYQPHLYVLPEDDANRQMANGFSLNSNTTSRKMQVLGEAGGWRAVLDRFEKDLSAEMRRFPERRILLLLDFDNQSDRLETVQAVVPPDLKERVFILGVRSEPEDLRAKLNMSFEEIGSQLAQECCDEVNDTWEHELLNHNAAELERLRVSVKPFLFS